VKFPKAFFWKNLEYYNFKRWILEQIWDEDKERLKIENPFCLAENRCKYCFITDVCNE
jgi:hypothetical protein